MNATRMNGRIQERRRGYRTGFGRAGFTLMEVVISVGVLAVAVPVVLAMVVAGGESSRIADDETRAVLVARSVVEEIRAAREGEGRVLRRKLDWPKFPATGDRLVLMVDGEGVLVRELEADRYASGERGGEARFLVSVKGVAAGPDRPDQNSPGGSTIEELSRVEVSVETPPVAAVKNRRKFVFVQLLHRDG